MSVTSLYVGAYLMVGTLVTCDPIPAYTKRLLVKGELVRATALPRGTTLDALLQGN